jgi:hypothetical protein
MLTKKSCFILLISLLIIGLAGCGGGGNASLDVNSSGAQLKSITVDLSWDAPITYTNGSSLTDIAGYKIYIGNCQRTYTQVINVGNVTSYVINNLAAGTYYVSVTVYNTSGIESDYSNELFQTSL